MSKARQRELSAFDLGVMDARNGCRCFRYPRRSNHRVAVQYRRGYRHEMYRLYGKPSLAKSVIHNLRKVFGWGNRNAR